MYLLRCRVKHPCASAFCRFLPKQDSGRRVLSSTHDNSSMAATVNHPPQTLGPIHPAKVEKSAIKPSIARSITIRVRDPLDHDAPAILHEPRSYNAVQANGSAVVLISGAGGGVSGPAGMVCPLFNCLVLLLEIDDNYYWGPRGGIAELLIFFV